MPSIFCLHCWEEEVQEQSSSKLILVFKAVDTTNGWLGIGQVTTAASCSCLLFPCWQFCSLSAEGVAQEIFVHQNVSPTHLVCDLVTKSICIFDPCKGMKCL